jgi:predicted ATP-dependent serine protease
MAFHCHDCGNRSAKKFPQGRCPACSSYNVQSDSALALELRERPGKTARDVILLMLLLVCLGFGVADIFQS